MRVWTIVGAVLILSVMPLRATAQTSSVDQVVDRIVVQEKAEMQMLRQYSPLVETYIQMLRPDAKLGRVPAGPQEWLPAYVYSEEGEVKYAMTRRLTFKSQTRLWGYNVGRTKQEQELNKIMVEAALPVKDQAEGANDYSPLQAQRNWDLQAEDNVVDRMERLGLLAPRGEVDKVLETVVNNIEVTNNLNIEPEVRCRVLTTSTLESFTISHTIVVSRGLIDVLPDEASLATLLARELGHVVLAHRIVTQYAFFDRMLFDEKDTFATSASAERRK